MKKISMQYLYYAPSASKALLTFGITCGLLGAPALLAQAAVSSAPVAATAAPLLVPQTVADVNTPPVAGPDESSSAAPVEVASALPEAPLPQVGNPTPAGRTPNGHPVAPLKDKYIPAGWQAQHLGVKGKIEVGATDLYSFEDFAAIILSAGYEHVLNSEPNYGTNSTAFAQRVGAAAAREASQGIFTDMIMANLTHEDPRYYQLGTGHSLIHRTFYAITRPLITRTDSGRETVNASLLVGYAGAAALTPAYYPQINHNFRDVASTYGGSIGGAALGFFVSEFSSDVLHALHIGHAQ